MTERAMAVVMTTTGNEEDAEKLSVTLIESRLAACVQELPIRSRYRWEGKVQRDQEILLLVKTAADEVDEVIEAIRTHHPYDVPEAVALPVAGGLAEYIDWVLTETGRKQV